MIENRFESESPIGEESNQEEIFGDIQKELLDASPEERQAFEVAREELMWAAKESETLSNEYKKIEAEIPESVLEELAKNSSNQSEAVKKASQKWDGILSTMLKNPYFSAAMTGSGAMMSLESMKIMQDPSLPTEVRYAMAIPLAAGFALAETGLFTTPFSTFNHLRKRFSKAQS